MRIKLMTFLAAATAFCNSFGQADVQVSKKVFKTDKPGFETAWKQVKQGDEYYEKGGVWYNDAVAAYKTAYMYNKSNPELNYKLGVSCLFSDRKDEAATYLLEALKLNPAVSGDILLFTGRALQYKGKYTEASQKINEWIQSSVKKNKIDLLRAEKYLAECKAAEESGKDSLRLEIVNMGKPINSTADDYAPVLNRGGNVLYFASRKPVSAKAKNYLPDTKFDENIYRSDFENGKWSVALPAGKSLTTENCETPLDIDQTGSILYLYSGFTGNGDIMQSKLKRGEWRTPEPETFGINSSSGETSLSISPRGDEIAFVSDRTKKGTGGKDIYFIYKKGRKWSKPVNAGEIINSSGNEETVRYSRTGDTLWFSSSGPKSTGGYDIFYTTRGQNNIWTQPANPGKPLNTPWNEFFFFPSPVKDNEFYFVSNRSGGLGGMDIYTGKFIVSETPVTIAVADSVIVEKPIINIQPDTILKNDVKISVLPDSLAVKIDSLVVRPDTIPSLIVPVRDTTVVSDTSKIKKLF